MLQCTICAVQNKGTTLSYSYLIPLKFCIQKTQIKQHVKYLWLVKEYVSQNQRLMLTSKTSDKRLPPTETKAIQDLTQDISGTCWLRKKYTSRGSCVLEDSLQKFVTKCSNVKQVQQASCYFI